MSKLQFILAFLGVTALSVYALIAAQPTRAAGTTITVNSSQSGSGSSGNCTLQEAIQAANTDTAVDACPAGVNTDIDEIVFDAVALPTPFTINRTSAYNISSDLRIFGDNRVTLDGGGGTRLFNITAGNVRLDRMIIQNGKATTGGAISIDGATTVVRLDEMTFVNNNTTGGGGALYITNGAAVNITESAFNNNQTVGSNGGAINITGATSTMTILDTVFNGNSAIRLPAPSTAGGDGGAIQMTASTVTITRAAIVNNAAEDDGAGIINDGGKLTISNSTISGNHGTVGTVQNQRGGGIATVSNGKTTLNFVTIANNSNGFGGGISSNGTANTAVYSITNSILIDNSAAITGTQDCSFESGIVTPTLKFNLINNASCPYVSPISSRNIYTNVSGLGALANNGGNTFTQALLTNSPAINAANSAACLPTDQRNVARPAGACDMGAYERVASGQLSLSKVASAPTRKPNETLLYTLTLSNNGDAAVSNVQIRDVLPSQLNPASIKFTNGGGVTAAYTTPNIDFTVGTIGINGSVVITVSGSLTGQLAVGTVFTNTATIQNGGGGSIAVGTASVATTVANANPVPQADTGITTAEESLVTIDVLANDSDPNGDVLTISSVTVPAHGTATINAGKVDYTPATNYFGTDTFNYTVSDGNGGSATASVTVNVTNTPDSPVFTSTPRTAAFVGSPYNYTVQASDPDGDVITITVQTKPTWLTLSSNGGGTESLTGTPISANLGPHSVVLKVTDSTGRSTTQSFTVTVNPANRAPSFTSTPVTAATQGEMYTYNIAATDPDTSVGDTLEITATTLPSWLTLTDNGNGTATLTGTPGANHVGPNSVSLKVTDSGSLSATQSFTIQVAAGETLIFIPIINKP